MVSPIALWTILLPAGCALSESELKALDDQADRIDLGSGELKALLEANRSAPIRQFQTLAATDGDQLLEFSDIYKNRDQDWVVKLVGSDKIEDHAAEVMQKMKTALAVTLIERDFPELAPVKMDLVKPLLSIPEYEKSVLSRKFLDAAAAALRLMQFRDKCDAKKDTHDVIEFVGGALKHVIEDILSGAIIISVEDNLPPTEDCPNGNKGEYIKGVGGAKDRIALQREVFVLPDEGLITLVHEGIHACYDHDGSNARQYTIDVLPTLNADNEQAIAYATSTAAFTLLYGPALLEKERAKRDAGCTASYEKELPGISAKVQAAIKDSRNNPIGYIHDYLIEQFTVVLAALAKRDSEVYGAELIMNDKLYSDAVIVELANNAAMTRAADLVLENYGRLNEIETQIVTDSTSALQCGLDAGEDPALMNLFPREGGYLNYPVFFALAKKRTQTETNGPTMRWWIDVQSKAVGYLKQGNIPAANALLDEAVGKAIDSATVELLRVPT